MTCTAGSRLRFRVAFIWGVHINCRHLCACVCVSVSTSIAHVCVCVYCEYFLWTPVISIAVLAANHAQTMTDC